MERSAVLFSDSVHVAGCLESNDPKEEIETSFHEHDIYADTLPGVFPSSGDRLRGGLAA